MWMFSHSSHWLTVAAGGRAESASAWGSFGGVVVALASAATVVVELAAAVEVVCAHAVTYSPVVPCQRGTTAVPPFRVAGDRCVVSLLVDFSLFGVKPGMELSNRLLPGVATIAAAVRAEALGTSAVGAPESSSRSRRERFDLGTGRGSLFSN